MHIYNWIIVASWAVFLLYWGISAFNVKPDTRSRTFNSMWGLRVLFLIVLAVAAAQFPAIAALLKGPVLASSSVAGWIGAVCAVVGIGFAVWARVHLGRDWSSHPDVKEGHELVTSGPYAYVRHPIYTGVILAAIGSGIGSSYFWVIIVFIVVVMFLMRIPTEERYMMELFPNQYPAYRARTKRLIPFIW